MKGDENCGIYRVNKKEAKFM